MNKNMGKNKLQLKKLDVVVIIVCLLAAFILAAGFIADRENARMLCISHAGKTLMTVALQDGLFGGRQDSDTSGKGIYYLITYEDGNTVIMQYEERPVFPSGISYNLVYVFNEEVRMEAADCRDQICVHHRPVTSSGESIICLPHRLVVELTGNGQEGMTDGMVK